MRYARNFAQAQKQEEKKIFECYYRAIRVAKMDGHRKNLALVRENLIEGDNDLTINVWENFLQVCHELNVDVDALCDTVKLHPSDKGKGNGYRIPSKHVDLMGHMKKKQRRARWRQLFREEFEMQNDMELDGEPVDALRRMTRPKLRAV